MISIGIFALLIIIVAFNTSNKDGYGYEAQSTPYEMRRDVYGYAVQRTPYEMRGDYYDYQDESTSDEIQRDRRDLDHVYGMDSGYIN